MSAPLGAAVDRMRREEALDEVVAYLGGSAQVNQADVARVAAEWKGLTFDTEALIALERRPPTWTT